MRILTRAIFISLALLVTIPARSLAGDGAWRLEAELMPPDSLGLGAFTPVSMCASDNVCFVGSNGLIHAFRLRPSGSWEWCDTLSGSGPVSTGAVPYYGKEKGFGSHIACNGDTLLAAAYQYVDSRDNDAVLYEFIPDSTGEWRETMRLVPRPSGMPIADVVAVPGGAILTCSMDAGRSLFFYRDATRRLAKTSSPLSATSAYQLASAERWTAAALMWVGGVDILRNPESGVWKCEDTLQDPLGGPAAAWGDMVAASEQSIGRFHLFRRNSGGEWQLEASLRHLDNNGAAPWVRRLGLGQDFAVTALSWPDGTISFCGFVRYGPSAWRYDSTLVTIDYTPDIDVSCCGNRCFILTPSFARIYGVDVAESTFASPDPSPLPSEAVLYQPHPNPFNPSTTIPYTLSEDADVSLVVHNILGQPVRTLANRRMTAGEHAASWDGRDERGQQVASGVYLVRMVAGDAVQVRKVTFVR